MSNRNVPVGDSVAGDRELTRLMAGLSGMVYRASAQPRSSSKLSAEGMNTSSADQPSILGTDA